MYRFAYTALLLLALSLGMASCQNDGYDTGDSAYSYITAELVLLHTNSNKAVAIRKSVPQPLYFSPFNSCF